MCFYLCLCVFYFAKSHLFLEYSFSTQVIDNWSVISRHASFAEKQNLLFSSLFFLKNVDDSLLRQWWKKVEKEKERESVCFVRERERELFKLGTKF